MSLANSSLASTNSSMSTSGNIQTTGTMPDWMNNLTNNALQSSGITGVQKPMAKPSYLSAATTKSGGLTSFLGSNIGGMIDSIGSAILPQVENSSGVNTAFQVGDTISSGLMAVNPALGGIAKGVMFGAKALNVLTGGKANTFNQDKEAFAEVGGDYSGTSALASDAASKSGKRYGGLFSGGPAAANRVIAEANKQQRVISQISENTKDDKLKQSTMSTIYNNKYGQGLNGGYNQGAIHSGKVGLKLPTKQDMKKIQDSLNKFKQGGQVASFLVATQPSIEEFKSGGQIKGNVIPEGALHARKNNMDNPDITKKGIPVVSENKDGLMQQAEIERNEIIFNKEVTTKLEEFYKDGSDEAAIECGKLLATEIVENTEDRTGLLKEMTTK